MAMARFVGEGRVTQIGSAVQIVDVCLAVPEGGIVEHRVEQLPIGLEAVELERPQGGGQPGDRELRSWPWAMSFATSES